MLGRGRGLFAIEVDDGGGFRAATTAEVDVALRQRELFGAAEYSVQHVGSDDRDDVDVSATTCYCGRPRPDAQTRLDAPGV